MRITYTQSPLVPVPKEECDAAPTPLLVHRANAAHSMWQDSRGRDGQRGEHARGRAPALLEEEEEEEQHESFEVSGFEDAFVPVCHRKARDECGQGANENKRRDKDQEVYRTLLKRIGVDTEHDDGLTFQSDSSDEALFWGYFFGGISLRVLCWDRVLLALLAAISLASCSPTPMPYYPTYITHAIYVPGARGSEKR
jgi:hypothetical protein